MNYIKDIFNAEKLLISNTVRTNTVLIKELLSENFVEYCSSGKVYNYKDGDVFAPLKNKIEIYDFEVKQLSSKIFLANYKTNETENDVLIRTTLRSSIWQKVNTSYKILFHQGTNIN
jgi:hypothetical protein